MEQYNILIVEDDTDTNNFINIYIKIFSFV